MRVYPDSRDIPEESLRSYIKSKEEAQQTIAL